MAKPGGSRPSRPVVESRLTDEKIEWMFAHVCRLPDIGSLAFGSLQANCFNAGTEAHYRLFWKVASDVYRDQGPQVFETLDYLCAFMEVELQSRIRDNPGSINRDQQRKLLSRSDDRPGLLRWIFEIVKLSELNIQWGKDLLTAFRVEREVNDALLSIASASSGKVITNLPETLRELSEQHIAITSRAGDRAESGAPPGWTPPRMNKVPTNVGFLDVFLKGGHASAEVYGVLGAYGSGKTSLAVQIAYQGAMRELVKAERDPEYHPKDWFFFSYEATADEIRVRLWAQACTIDHHKLEEYDREALTTADNGVDSLDDYERQYFDRDIRQGVVLGERERLDRTIGQLNINFWVHDMVSSENPKKGSGYVDEIASLIQTDISEWSRRDGWQHEVGGVVVDYAGACAKRHMDERGIQTSETRHYIGGMGAVIKRKVAVAFHCPVWLFHQLSAQSNKRAMTAEAHHADAAEARNFAENLVFCFQLGTKDPKTSTLYLSCTKARRGAVGKSPLLELEGLFYRFREAKGFVVNTYGEVISEREGAISGVAPQGVESIPFDQDRPLDDLGEDLDSQFR
jgi:hypothetical protein